MQIGFICVTSALLSFYFIAAEEGIHVVHKHSTSFGNKKYIINISTPRRPVNRSTSITSMDVYFLPNTTLESSIYIKFTANKKFTTQYRPFMINIKLDLCDALILKNHPLYIIVFDNVNRSESNMLDPCPIKGHRFVKPYYTGYKKLPQLIPIGTWRTDVFVTKKYDNYEDLVFRFHDYYEVTPIGIVEF